MKYIEKKDAPIFFIEDTDGLTLWSEYYSHKKRKLKKYILDNEQFGLCCYCEKKITTDANSSHVEHIEPKKTDIINLTFNYNNLLVSCEGNHFNEFDDKSKNTCGHKKNYIFDDKLFLNPTLIVDISDYFVFDNNGVISSSSKDKEKSEYTYKLLNLNGKNDKLAEARKITKNALILAFQRFSVPERKEKLKKYLQNNNNEFITFLRYRFKYLIN